MSHIRCYTQYQIHGQEFDKNSPSGVFAPKAGSPEGEQVGLLMAIDGNVHFWISA